MKLKDTFGAKKWNKGVFGAKKKTSEKCDAGGGFLIKSPLCVVSASRRS